MGCCSRMCAARTCSIVFGLAAFSCLAVSVLLFPWVLIHVTSPTAVLNTEPVVDVGSGEEELLFTTARPHHTVYTKHNFIYAGMCRLCVKDMLTPQHDRVQGYAHWSIVGNTTNCWAISPLVSHWEPDESYKDRLIVNQVDMLSDIPHKAGVRWPVLASGIGTVVAIMLTSAGMAMNNAVLVVGAVLYLFSGLALCVSALEFYLMATYSANHFSWYHGRTPNPMYTASRHIGLGIFCIGIAFLCLCFAAAFAMAYYKMNIKKVGRRNLIRKERMALRFAPPKKTEMVQIVTKM